MYQDKALGLLVTEDQNCFDFEADIQNLGAGLASVVEKEDVHSLYLDYWHEVREAQGLSH